MVVGSILHHVTLYHMTYLGQRSSTPSQTVEGFLVEKEGATSR